ncbi:MAG: hypothetical protein JKY51_10605 [Opitutaceae bacterium]|nr:hypothetical protein [Opitutaceae bacterium]
MAKKNEPESISVDDTYAVTVRLPGQNLKEILDGGSADFTPEQALLFGALKNVISRRFSTKDFKEWHADFLEATSEKGTPTKLRVGRHYIVEGEKSSAVKKKTAAKNN